MDLKTVAQEMLNAFESKNRVDTGEQYYCLADDKEEWMQDICRNAHNDMLPDDFKYQFIHTALELMSEYDDADEGLDSLEPDTYNRDLLKWISSNLSRANYVDEAYENAGYDGLYNTIRYGQLEEMREVYALVREGLEARLDE